MKSHITTQTFILALAFTTAYIFCVAFNSGQGDIGLANIDWKKTSEGNILIWKKSEVKKTFEVFLYSPDLVLQQHYERKLDNARYSFKLRYDGESYYEFTIWDPTSAKSGLLRLSNTLSDIKFSAPRAETGSTLSDSTFEYSLIRENQNVDALRLDSELWELQSIKLHGANKSSLVLTNSYEIGLKSFPEFKKSWQLQLADSAFEHARIIAYEYPNIFVYVNFETNNGRQYVYCLDVRQQKVKFRSRLTISGVQACIYSHCLYDRQRKTLLVGGTRLLKPYKEPRGLSGLFLLQIDSVGEIRGTYHRQAFNLWYPSQTDSDGISTQFTRAAQTYSRFVSMEKTRDGYIHIITEAYSILARNPERGKEGILHDDLDHHFFVLQNMWFKVSPGMVVPVCEKCTDPVLLYRNNYHLELIENYDSLKDNSIDFHYKDNINTLSDSILHPSHFVDHVSDDSLQVDRVLFRELFHTPNGNAYKYFYRDAVTRKNATALTDPSPVPGQNFTVQKHYLIRDRNSLYELTSDNLSFSVKSIPW